MKRFVCVLLVCIIATVSPSVRAASPPEEYDIEILLPSGINGSFTGAIRGFERESGLSVGIEYYDESADDLTRANVKTMADGGPDIYFAPDIPFWEYAEKGAFADIGELIENDGDFDLDNFLKNILDPLRDNDGHLYVMPFSYSFEAVLINRPLLDRYGIEITDEWTIQSMVSTESAFRDKNTDGNNITFSGGRAFYSAMLTNEILCAVDFIKGTTDIEAMDTALFEYLKDMYSSTGMIGLSGYPPDITSYLYFNIPGCLNNFKSVRGSILCEYPEFDLRIFPRASASQPAGYSLEYAFCINSGGNVEGAWELIKYLLSDGEQSKQYITNPVSKSATERRIGAYYDELRSIVEEYEDGAALDTLIQGTRHTPEEFEGLFDRYIETYRQMIASLGAVFLQDSALTGSVRNVLQNTGEGTDAAKMQADITNIARTYLEESGGDTSRGYTVIYIAAGAFLVAAVTIVIVRVAKRRKGSGHA